DEPERASRPWDRARDGFVLGEGAAVVVLERADHAAARGARSYARLAGAGLTSAGFDTVQPDPEGTGAARAMTAQLRDGRLTGGGAVLTSTKSMTGHLLGAAGALESVATILAVHHGAVPPTINLDDPEDGLDLDVAAGKPRHMEVPAALNNAFGFGGHNVALLFTKH